MKINLLLVTIFTVTNSYCQTTVKEVGISDSDFTSYSQQKSMWCWAACIQMILHYNHVYVPQTDIVERTFGKNYTGEIPNLGGSVQVISNNLNKWEVDLAERPMQVKSVFYYHPPSPSELIYFLKNKQPIYLSYKSGLNSNHAIVITSCRYIEDKNGITINEITVRDPWPSAKNLRSDGLLKYNYSTFYNLMNYYWIVSVRRKGDVSASSVSFNNCDLPICNSIQKTLKSMDNNFKDLYGEKIGPSQIRVKSTIVFPGERSNMISKLENDPYYYISFYKGNRKDSSDYIFEDLKSVFSSLDIKLEVLQEKRFDKSKPDIRKTINIIFTDEKVITIHWTYTSNKKEYSVGMTFQKKDRLY